MLIEKNLFRFRYKVQKLPEYCTDDDSWVELVGLIQLFRHKTNDDIVIYSGYYEPEISDMVEYLRQNYDNIIIKFGRYIPNQQSHYDEVLGIELASDNQYAERIS